jgi:hypothetical protein
MWKGSKKDPPRSVCDLSHDGLQHARAPSALSPADSPPLPLPQVEAFAAAVGGDSNLAGESVIIIIIIIIITIILALLPPTEALSVPCRGVRRDWVFAGEPDHPGLRPPLQRPARAQLS